jgi:FkbM family methyltransferase
MAVSDHRGTLKLFTHPLQKNDPITTSVSASLITDKFGDNSGYYEVSTATLDQFFIDIVEFEIVKIDIEGAEMLLVDQIIENADKIKRLLVETHERFMLDSEMSEIYQRQLNKLNDYITVNKLEKVWLTDWI